MAKTKETKKENIVTVNTVESTKTTFIPEHALLQTKDNVKTMNVSDVMALAHALNYSKYHAEKIDIDTYDNTETVISNLTLRLRKETDLGKLNYADLASLCRLIALSTLVTVYKSKDTEKHAEPIFMNCKSNGTLFFRLMKQDINFSTVSNIANDKLIIKSIKCNKKASDKNDEDTNILYESIDRDCAIYMKKKGVFNWNMEKVVDNYRLSMLHAIMDTVRDSHSFIETIAEIESK